MPTATIAIVQDSGRRRDPLAYPFDIRSSSFVWKAGQVDELGQGADWQVLIAGRIPVLAIGSNAAPSQLNLKFKDSPFRAPNSRESEIPVLHVVANDVDVVYAAHIALYGSVPATLIHSAGSRAHVFATWLTPVQFEQMGRTERLGESYRLCSVRSIEFDGNQIDEAYAFVSIAGAAIFNGRAVGLAAVRVEHSALPRLDQVGMWDLVAEKIKASDDGSGLMQQVIDDDARRQEMEAALGASASADEMPEVSIFPVYPTRPVHHSHQSEPYVVAVSTAEYRRLGRSRLATVSALVGRRRTRCIAYVIEDKALADDKVLLDQTVRTALGVMRSPPEGSPPEGPLGFVSLTSIKLGKYQRLANRLSWIAGRRYILLRAFPPDPADIEKTLCRLTEDDQRSIGVEVGGRILLIAADRSEGRLRRSSVQALALTDPMRETRFAASRPDWASRYPDVAALLNVEGHNDLRPVWIDRDIREALDLRVGDVVLCRRSLPNALLSQLLDFGVVLLASILALDRILPHPEWVSTLVAVGVTMIVMVVRLRSHLG
jgi:hypothetical protein